MAAACHARLNALFRWARPGSWVMGGGNMYDHFKLALYCTLCNTYYVPAFHGSSLTTYFPLRTSSGLGNQCTIIYTK